MEMTWIPISDGAMAECPKYGETYIVDSHGGTEEFAKFSARNKFCPNCGARMDGDAE